LSLIFSELLANKVSWAKANVRYINSVLSLFFTGLKGFALGLLALGSLFLAQTEDPGGYSFLDVFGYSGLGLSVIMLIRVAIQSMKRPQKYD